jgi:hypothetical protein
MKRKLTYMERRTRSQNEDTMTTYAYLSELSPSITNILKRRQYWSTLLPYLTRCFLFWEEANSLEDTR